MPAGDAAKVEAYLAQLPAAQQAALRRLRGQIRRAAPGAQEGFGYGLPGFYLDGPLFYYGAGKSHCALYGARPPGFEPELAGFQRSKGTVRFTPEAPLPAGLVRRLVQARLKENRERAGKSRGKGSRRPAASRGRTASSRGPPTKATARRAQA